MSQAKESTSKSQQLSTNLSNLKDLTTKRSSIKGRITKFRIYLLEITKTESPTAVDLSTLTQRFEKFRDLSFSFDELQTQIEILNSSNLDTELDIREEFELDFATLIGQTQVFLESTRPQKLGASSMKSAECNHSCNNNSIGFKLPIITISKFDGTYFKWVEFRDTFTSLIHNNDKIDSIHKFQYLNSYLEGEASGVISNLEVSTINYKEAWRLLCERYNNEKLLINNHLNSLFNLQTIARDSAKDIRILIDHVSKHLRALHNLGEPVTHWDSLLVHMVSSKLDGSTSFKWEEHKNNLTKTPSLKDFFTFLRSRADILESVRSNKIERQSVQKNNETQSSSNRRPEKSYTKSFTITAADGSSIPACVLCEGGHRLYDCASFLAKPVEERISEVARLRLCFNCLRKGHSSHKCRLGPCSKCRNKHNTLLHREFSPATNISNVHAITTTDADNRETPDDSIVSMSVSANNSVLLSTALVDAFNPHTNKNITIRALLDSGSQTSLITEGLKNKLELTPQSVQVDIVGIGNTHSSNAVQRCIIAIKSRASNFESKLSCLVLPQISSNLPNKVLDISEIKLPANIQLADPSFHQPAPVDMLIGADMFWCLIESEQMHLSPNQPIMRKSKLGWILAGPLFTYNTFNNATTTSCNHLTVQSNSDFISNEGLNESLTKFWEIEQIPQPVTQQSDEENQCESHFISNTYRNNQGRFCVKLPLHTEPDCLGNSMRLAKIQFLALEKRLLKNPVLKKLYSSFIQEYSDLGHLSEATSVSDQTYFIPHHAVWKPTSESTKLRVVFNGSAKTTSGYSINDLQMVGPHIQDSLFNILLRFRQYTYVLSGDVEKMYRQVLIQDCHRDLQIILWRENVTDPLKLLKLNTVTYGYSSSSYLSTRCLWQLGDECTDSNIKEIIQNDFLVDDLLTGSDDSDHLMYIKQSVESTLSSGCFNLRKYRSNLPIILGEPQNIQHDLTISSSPHTLGVGWNPNEDYIHFPSDYGTRISPPTKRSILSDSCKIFDPLGLLSIITIVPKILIQRLWLDKIDWDAPVSIDIREQWESFINDLKYLHAIHIPRHVMCHSPTHTEMHCFCDASKNAYATCIYLKSLNAQGEVTVRLLCAKARVASVKPVTIPRLELCACLLGAQLAAAVCRALRCVIARKVFWTDSSIALSWLGIRYDKLKTFVANRVGAILELTENSEWRHVPTDLNPADLASRGVSANKIANYKLWWNGPTFLLNAETTWPNIIPNKHSNSIQNLPEVKVNVITNVESNQQLLIDFNRYSKLSFLQRSVAYVLRFINNCKNKCSKRFGILGPEELASSLDSLVKLSQGESFPRELEALCSSKQLSPKSTIISLSPFLEQGIIRVGGRLDNSSYSYEKRHPMLLHSKHKLTKLLFQQEHIRLLHAGPQLLLASIREFVWPIAGRDLARTTARHCVVCRRASGKGTSPIMGMLPAQRVNPGFPFVTTGVDFAGPFLISDRKGRGCKISKCYLCVFICFRYKCVHLEAVSELSKDAFILSLRRFISRRGKPTEMFCDNGRNFVATSNELSAFLKSNVDDIEGFASGEGIKFLFQPAYAPHFGGLWESAVKSAKFHLKRVLGNAHLTYEELATLFSQIEAILNSRPLYPLSSSPDDFAPLTPGHFLVGRPITSLQQIPDLRNKNQTRLDRFQRLELLRQHFWDRWRSEYIAELQQKQKWRSHSRSLQPGDLVLLKEDNTPPMQWKMGRITSLFPGNDGIARVAEVKTPTGSLYRRAVRYLCPLLEPTEESSLEPKDSKAPEDVPA